MRNIYLAVVFLTGIFTIQGFTLSAQLKKDKNSSTRVGTLNGDIIKDKGTKNVYTTINKKYVKEESIEALAVSKYLDVNKDMLIVAGTNKVRVLARHLENGIWPFQQVVFMPGGEKIIFLKLVDGKLKISADIDDFEGKYIAKIRDNKLILGKNYHRYTSDRYFEIYDDYYIPVLQIELVKNQNSIFINGVFNYDKGCYIFSNSGLITKQLKKDKFLMPPQEKDSFLKVIRETAKIIKPVHE